ncbi:MAG: GGDEF domain-containing protein [Chromatiales bacterium]
MPAPAILAETMTASDMAYCVSERTLSDLARSPSSLAANTLHLANVLQSTLDLGSLLELFAQEVDRIVPHDGMEYVNDDEQVRISQGHDAPNSCSYNLLVLDKSLGQLAFKRDRRFTTVETDQLEALICALVYPLRNAIRYKRALDTAFKDPVTGINNRAALNATMDREVNLAHRHSTALSVIMLDLDHFKRVNDSYGHLAGDFVLRSLARRLTDCTRGSDMVFRYGGEEFTVVLSSTDTAGACLLADRIRQSVERMDVHFENIKISVTASVGVATLTQGDNAAALLARADQALYNAKADGRNRVVCCDNNTAL